VRAASSTHGSRRGPHSAAPNGAVEVFPQGRRRGRLSCSTGTSLGAVRETPGFAQKIKNRGNEAKESLKTKDVPKTTCAKRTHICARKRANEVKKATFRCKNGTSTGAVPLSQVKSPPGALCIAGICKARTCQRTACLMRYQRPRQATPHPSPSTDGLMKAPSRDTLPDFWGPMVRFGSDQKSGSSGRGRCFLVFLPTANSPLPTAHCLLPTVHLPTALKRFHYPTVSGRL